MEINVLKDPELVVALDIGSTYSGYAWQWRDKAGKYGDVEFNLQWGAGSVQLHKTSTCLLLNKDYQVDSFGHLAEKRFCTQCDRTPNDMHGKWYFFKRFKLLLYRESFKEEILIDDYLGQLLPLKDVMTKFIGALKNDFVKTLKGKGHNIDFEKILWVITVPAIWSQAAKKFMRDAAEADECGINRGNLLLVNEPEAAALYYTHLPSEEQKAMQNVGAKGNKFLSVDLGGGTVDISAIEVLEDGMLKEICAGTGSLTGGQDINNAFFQACKDVFHGNIWHETFDQRNAEELLKMEEDFEKSKISIGSTNPIDEDISLSIPYSMMEMLKSKTLKLKDTKEFSNQFRIDKGKFMFNSSYIRNTLFLVTLSRIMQSITEVVAKTKDQDIQTVVLVGGFAESKLVVEWIKDTLGNSNPGVHVVVPTSPFRAVLTGAVLYGHNPLIFYSRVSKLTYGIGVYTLFNREIHDESKKWFDPEEQKDYCSDTFSIHVKRDENVVLNTQQPSHSYIPKSKKSKNMVLPIYSSTSYNPTYTTDDSCKKLAEIAVELPDKIDDTKKSVEVTMIYGGTELSVIAVEKATGKEYKAEIKFDQD